MAHGGYHGTQIIGGKIDELYGNEDKPGTNLIDDVLNVGKAK